MNYKFANRIERVKPSAIRELLKLGADPSIISFGGGYPDPEIFPIEKLRKVYDQVLQEEGKLALQYTGTEGLMALREKLVNRVQKIGISCDVDNLFIIQGGQQGLDLAAKAFIDHGDVIITENPTFLGALAAFNPYEPEYIGVSMDENGMRMDELEAVLQKHPNAKLIYTVPEFQNPTGVTMSLERRKALVELANKYNVVIVEDSPYREIRYEGEDLPAIKSFDTEGRVIHIGSFSKILSPGLRLGWLIADSVLAEKLSLLKMASDTQNSTLNMYAVNRFMDMYDLDKHIAHIRDTYKYKKEVMFQTLRETFPKSITYTNPQGGLFTWITFPEHIDTRILMQEQSLPIAKVAYVPGESFFPCMQEKNHCRINYSYMSEENIVKGITNLGEIVKELC
ncbi:aminotransferase-like domain-containing protein [Niallia sp. FSL W8-0635]|uniref:aminotransferase-like domain-containing protein n=1 Tax=Niallia sp. FSL W8-0635 TaxID=2975337 RepID=UPI002B01E03E|nr:PLP-dependent aminotransferase family protein [Yersinia enterocolitica]